MRKMVYLETGDLIFENLELAEQFEIRRKMKLKSEKDTPYCVFQLDFEGREVKPLIYEGSQVKTQGIVTNNGMNYFIVLQDEGIILYHLGA